MWNLGTTSKHFKQSLYICHGQYVYIHRNKSHFRAKFVRYKQSFIKDVRTQRTPLLLLIINEQTGKRPWVSAPNLNNSKDLRERTRGPWLQHCWTRTSDFLWATRIRFIKWYNHNCLIIYDPKIYCRDDKNRSSTKKTWYVNKVL